MTLMWGAHDPVNGACFNGVSGRDQFGLKNTIFGLPVYFMNSRDENQKRGIHEGPIM